MQPGVQPWVAWHTPTDDLNRTKIGNAYPKIMGYASCTSLRNCWLHGGGVYTTLVAYVLYCSRVQQPQNNSPAIPNTSIDGYVVFLFCVINFICV